MRLRSSATAGFLVLACGIMVPAAGAQRVAPNGTARHYTISGRVANAAGAGFAGVTVQLSGSATAAKTTDGAGAYAFSFLPEAGSYTVTVSGPCCVFAQSTQTIPALWTDQTLDFLVTSGRFTKLFAEGAVSSFFDTRFALLNVTGTPATVTMTFQTGAMHRITNTFGIAGLQRLTVDPKTFGLTDAEFSTEFVSDQPLVIERNMDWSDVPLVPGQEASHLRHSYGSHAETGIDAAGVEWYLAEGATLDPFDLFYLVQNPSANDANVEVTFLRPAPRPAIRKTYRVAARSRKTIWVNIEDPGLANDEIAGIIRSTNGVPIAAERAMYLSRPGYPFLAGHQSAAQPAPALSWLFAEGATGPIFDTFLLIANPTTQDARVNVSLLGRNGARGGQNLFVPAFSRATVWVDLLPGFGSTEFTAAVGSGSVPVVAERVMWWRSDPANWSEAHASAGYSGTAGVKWAIADGELFTGEDMFVRVLGSSTQFRATLLFEDGTQTALVLANANAAGTTIDVRAQFPIALGKRFGVLVENLDPSATAGLFVERSSYRDALGVRWEAGANAWATKIR